LLKNRIIKLFFFNLCWQLLNQSLKQIDMISKTTGKIVFKPGFFRVVFFVLSLTFTLYGYAQQGVGINASGVAAHSSAMLDVSSASKGLLIPRVSLTSTTDVTTIPSPAISLLVYNTNTSMVGGAVGFWFFNGTSWVQAIGPQGIQGPVGATGAQGPAGVAGAQGPVGPTGAVGPQGPQGAQGAVGATGPAGPVGCSTANMVIKSNGTAATCSQIIDNGANVGIGTTSPAQKLDVAGNLAFSGALMPNNASGTSGQVLVSQGGGAAPIWQNPASVPMYGNNAQSVKLTSIQGTTSATFTDIPGMSLTVNTIHNTFYVFASFTARLANSSTHYAALGQIVVSAQILVDGVSQAKAAAVITDYDMDYFGGEYLVTSGGVAFNGIPVTMAPGSHTIKIQWCVGGYYWESGAWVEINPLTFTDTGDHCILTIFD